MARKEVRGMRSAPGGGYLISKDGVASAQEIMELLTKMQVEIEMLEAKLELNLQAIHFDLCVACKKALKGSSKK